MSNVGQLLDKIKMFYPPASNFTDAQIVDIINDVQWEVFRDIQQEGIYEFLTVANQAKYVLASDMSLEFIKFVGICPDTTVTANSVFQEYTYARPDEELLGYKYWDGQSMIGIYPIPETSGYNIKIIYDKRPSLLSELVLTGVPDLNSDWHKILVYGAIIELAGAGTNPDIDVVNNYTIKYNQLYSQMTISKYDNEPKYPKIKDVTRKNRRSVETVVIPDVT